MAWWAYTVFSRAKTVTDRVLNPTLRRADTPNTFALDDAHYLVDRELTQQAPGPIHHPPNTRSARLPTRKDLFVGAWRRHLNAMGRRKCGNSFRLIPWRSLDARPSIQPVQVGVWQQRGSYATGRKVSRSGMGMLDETSMMKMVASFTKVAELHT